ncbi:MAG: alpha-1,6-mannanase [Bacteroidales bacterium]|nr:alpha-1,6-mannanase [Bacteroidales bacterium]
MKLKFIITAVAGMAILLPAGAKTIAPPRPVVAPVSEEATLDDVWTAYDAFNNVYLDKKKYIYKNTDHDRAARGRDRGAAAIWCQPMYVDMALNAVELAKKTGDTEREKEYSDLLKKLIDGNIDHYLNFDFDNCDQNRGWFIYDDIQWWTITLARAYLATGDERLRSLAERSFARVWYGSPIVGDTGSYADPEKGLGGGMFWQWQPIDGPRRNRPGDGKMSCINFPTVVAAMLLHEAAPAERQPDPEPTIWSNSYGDFVRPAYETKDRYLEMAKEIYDWSVANLADKEDPGKIYDNRHGDNVGGHPLIYNQGTYIGASALLYLKTGDERYLKNAMDGANYSINTMSAEHGMLPWAHNHRNPYDQGSLEQGIYPAIWIEYMKLLTDNCGQEQYKQFILRNINEGWKNRDRTRNICDGESWKQTTDDRVIGSYAASSVPAMMLATGLFEY